jgi:hypothetical protein
VGGRVDAIIPYSEKEMLKINYAVDINFKEK